MAKRNKESNTYPYRSKFSIDDYYISAAEVVAEKLCENRAKMQKCKLPDKFWEDIQWKQLYKSQSLIAKGLLKIYPLDAIIYALNSSCQFVYSLHSAKIDIAAKEYIKKRTISETIKDKVVEEKEQLDINDGPRKQFNNPNNLLGRL